MPFPVCDPRVTYATQVECTPINSEFAFRPGAVVPMLIGRCYENWFRPSDQAIGYTIERAIVSDGNGIRILLGSTFTDMPPGCAIERSVLHAVPVDTPNGAYHFEGVSQVVGRDYLWRSQSFRVEP